MKTRPVEAKSASVARTSDLLRNILIANPNVETFTVGQILDSLGADRAETSLLFFSMPSLVPANGLPPLPAVSAGLVAGQMAAGAKTIRLPKIVLDKKVPRRSLAVAVHAMTPVIEAAEKVAKPRLKWASCPLARRVLGVLVFVLAVAIAFPVIGFDPLHAASISTISLGLAEQDGLAILLGVTAGLISLALIATSGLTAKLLKSKVVVWLRKLVRRTATRALAAVCERRGWKWLAAVLRFEWQELLLAWNPEKRAAEKQERAARKEPTTTRRDRPASRTTERRTAAKPSRSSQPLAMA
ncbi:exopolysaccharide biosynthesis protein [Methylopila sp. M107]|uniref:exopolysaccharide biosynthesis protein n=1 Tax=Methylopila sp. M107 TaxID=1101190 RepID=UPI00036B8A30|nr:exopolysaccharide biosynthesis protein [Methylopila sp. M107]